MALQKCCPFRICANLAFLLPPIKCMKFHQQKSLQVIKSFRSLRVLLTKFNHPSAGNTAHVFFLWIFIKITKQLIKGASPSALHIYGCSVHFDFFPFFEYIKRTHLHLLTTPGKKEGLRGVGMSYLWEHSCQRRQEPRRAKSPSSGSSPGADRHLKAGPYSRTLFQGSFQQAHPQEFLMQEA